jgi:hypothetical protein
LKPKQEKVKDLMKFEEKKVEINELIKKQKKALNIKLPN